MRLAIPFAAARIAVDHHVTRGGQQLKLVKKRLPVLRMRTAMDLEHRRIFSARLESHRFDHPHMNLHAVGGIDPLRLRFGELDLFHQRAIEARENLRPERAGFLGEGTDGDLQRRPRIANRERGARPVGAEVAQGNYRAALCVKRHGAARGGNRRDVRFAMPADVRENPPAVGTPLQVRAERGIGTIAQDRGRQTVIFTTGQIASPLFVHVVKIQPRIVDAPRLFAFPAGEGNVATVGGPAHDLLMPLGEGPGSSASCRCAR